MVSLHLDGLLLYNGTAPKNSLLPEMLRKRNNCYQYVKARVCRSATLIEWALELLLQASRLRAPDLAKKLHRV